MFQKTFFVRQAAKNKDPWRVPRKGQFFPIAERFVDARVSDRAAQTYTEIQYSKKELRGDFITGNMRQTAVPERSLNVRPTHFFSLRVPQNSHFMTQIHTVYADIADYHAEHSKLLIPTQKLHVTASVMVIEDEDVANIVEAAQSVVLDSKLAPVRLFSRGLGQFKDRVLFTRISPEKDFGKFDRFVKKLRETLGDDPSIKVDFKGNPNDSYVPHVTIAKIRPKDTAVYGNAIPREVWASYQYEDFGEFVAPSLDLCEMRTDATTGYYKVVASIPLSP